MNNTRPQPPSVGAPVDRVDGRLKVTGAARYAAEYVIPGVTHAVIVTSTVASGRIASVDVTAAQRVPGVLRVFTPFDAPRLQVPMPGAHPPPPAMGGDASGGRGQTPGGRGGPPMRVPTVLQDKVVHYNGQPIALVVAETFEQATEAAGRVRPEYVREAPVLSMATAPNNPPETVRPISGERLHKQGDFALGLLAADVKVDEIYTTPIENHNPMEVHTTLAVWNAGELTLYESTQGITSVRDTVARAFGMPREQVRVVAYFTGGGFGSKGGAWSHEILAAMAARELKRPVKLALTRRQMFGPVGGRPHTQQHLTLGATHDGTLTALRHTSRSNTSTIEDWVEPALSPTRMLYACPNRETEYNLVRLNVGSPTFMRAPGESSGTYALECAMDELAVALKMDAVALRLKNYADRDPETGRPWSSKSLRECYALAGEKFGWSRRQAEPRSMRDGDWLVGWGVATATYPARRMQAGCVARMGSDGIAVLRAGSQEIGCGTYTIMTQIGADALGLPVESVRFELGDTNMPENPASTGSISAASTGSAVHEAAMALRAKLVQMAVADDKSPLRGASADSVRTADGNMSVAGDASRRETYAAVIARYGGNPVEVTAESRPGAEVQQYAMHSFGAVYTEVRVDPQLGIVRIPRIVTAHGVGRVLNEKTARSQIQGGVVWGIGMALTEETQIDPRSGRYMNADLAEYHVPVNADVGMIDVHFVDEHDEHVGPLGVKGAGEIGITGVAASIANAVFHATGKRVRDLPIRVERVIA